MKRLIHVLAVAALVCAETGVEAQSARGQTPPAAPGAPPPAVQLPSPPAEQPASPPSPPRRSVSATNTNIRVDIAIIDESGPQPLRKVISLITVDGLRSSLRRAGGPPDPTNLNVDATATIERNGKISTRITFFYRPDQTAKSLNLDFAIVLEDGKSIVASRTPDLTVVEVTATILK
jgi:hypothetical protein